MNENNSELVFFDGVCVLCNNWVKFVIKNDKKKKNLNLQTYNPHLLKINYQKKILRLSLITYLQFM